MIKLEHEVCLLGVLFAIAMLLLRFNRQSGSDRKSKIESRKVQ